MIQHKKGFLKLKINKSFLTFSKLTNGILVKKVENFDFK